MDSVLKTLIGFVIQCSILVTAIQIALLAVFYASSSQAYWYVEPGDVYPLHSSADGDTDRIGSGSTST